MRCLACHYSLKDLTEHRCLEPARRDHHATPTHGRALAILDLVIVAVQKITPVGASPVSLGAHGRAGESNGCAGELPDGTGDLPGSAGALPARAGDLPGSAGDLPGRAGVLPACAGDLPGGAGELPGCAGELHFRTIGSVRELRDRFRPKINTAH